MRFWLCDLAEELNAGLNDGTLPKQLALDRVWITAEGRAKLLDFPAPGADRESPFDGAAPIIGEDFDRIGLPEQTWCRAE